MTPSTALYSIERQAIEVLNREMERYLESNQPPPPSLVQLLKNTHEMVMKRLKAALGEKGELRSPREMLVELAQFQAELREMLDQQERMEALDS